MDNLDYSVFLQELRSLMEKYRVGIGFDVGQGSDTHGLYDEKMVISARVGDSFKTVDILEVDGWGIDYRDIPEKDADDA
jgi:hypothetical protein